MSKTVKKVIKCFCGCSELTEEEVKNIVICTIDSFVKNDLGKTCFRNYMKIGYTNDTPYVIEVLNCYELSQKLLHNQNERTDENYEELFEIIPTPELEDDLRKHIDEDEVCNWSVNKSLRKIKRECKLIIEQQDHYTKFKETMLEKIKK